MPPRSTMCIDTTPASDVVFTNVAADGNNPDVCQIYLTSATGCGLAQMHVAAAEAVESP